MKKILALTILLFSLNANAWLYLEPYIGYDISLEEPASSSGINGQLQYNGGIFGARIGFQWTILMLGVDLSGMSGNSTLNIGGNEFDYGITKGTYGAFAGVNIDLTVIGLRAWFSYFFSNKLSFKDNQPIDEMKGNGYGLGAGLTILKFIGINFEWRIFDYKDFIVGDFTYDGEYKPSEFVISLSVPLNLF